MIRLLSKLKDECHRQDIDLMHSEINGNAIKLACNVNGRRDTELNAYIIPDGDGFNFYTMTPQGEKSQEKKVAENEIMPNLVSALTGEVVEPQVDEEMSDAIDVVTIEVADEVYDTKEVAHGTYKNSRYAYSDTYHKMGTIVDIQTKSTRQMSSRFRRNRRDKQ